MLGTISILFIERKISFFVSSEGSPWLFMLKVFSEQDDVSPDAEDIVVNHEDFMEVHHLLSHAHS